MNKDMDIFENITNFFDDRKIKLLINSIDGENIIQTEAKLKSQIGGTLIMLPSNNDIIDNKAQKIRGLYGKCYFEANISKTLTANYPETKILDYIYFTYQDSLFLDDDVIEIDISTNDIYTKYLKRYNYPKVIKTTWLDFQNKYIYYCEMLTIIHQVAIIPKLIHIKANKKEAILFQSHIYKDEKETFTTKFRAIDNSFVAYNPNIYLENYVDYKIRSNTFNILLYTYLYDYVITKKKDYYLNDIAGFIDLFDAMFYNVGGQINKMSHTCCCCGYSKKYKTEHAMKVKIKYISNKLNFKIDKNTIEILTKFRNTIRHPRNKSLNFIDIDKVISYCGNMVYVYFMKCVLKIESDDFDYNCYICKQKKLK